ncbi:MAG: hypothetical protein ACD_4C00076G0007 [uncultured bacterium (gcode 4)]|uniref:Uncharacterized protein n=1 Tax=uncultured bacterium (gcode 4) TaxID=1234023 RepID=K2GA82_9BACT|nr:MAG: hypothetical protein ACD_4C00076G0007 [uncultured bacterium (gcode 4)]
MNIAQNLLKISLNRELYELVLETIVSWLNASKLNKNWWIELLEKLDEIRLKFNEKTNLIKIIEEIINYNLYKEHILYDTNNEFFSKHTIKNINPREFKKNSNYFKEPILIINYLKSWSTRDYISDVITNWYEDATSSIDMQILLKYYKDSLNDYWKIQDIFDKYEKTESNFNSKFKKINCIYIGNYLLSSLIHNYHSIKTESEERELEKSIELAFKRIERVWKRILSFYSNYFTDYKYSQYKLIKAKKLLNYKSFNASRITLDQALSHIEKSIKIYDENKDYDCFYYTKEETIIDCTENTYLKRVYVPKLYVLHSNSGKEKQKLIKIKNEIEILLSSISLREKIHNVENKIDSNKIESVQIIWIFAWIVLFASWTLQIFTRLDNLWDAITLELFYCVSILVIISAIDIRDWRYWFKSKYFSAFILALFIIVISLFIYPYYKTIPLKENLIDSKTEKLNDLINRAEDREKTLNELINKINNKEK